jgi:hypothetical protein
LDFLCAIKAFGCLWDEFFPAAAQTGVASYHAVLINMPDESRQATPALR